MRACVVLGVWLAIASASPAAAQPSTASDTADRPGFADSALVLGAGRVQLEGGVLFEESRPLGGSIRTLTLPQAQLRFGVSSRLDVSLWWDGLLHMSSGGLGHSNATGAADPRVGGKLQVVHRDAFDLAVVASIGLPIGSEDFSSGDPDPLARLSWSVSLTPSLGLAGTLDVAEDRRDGLWRPRPAVSAALNGSFGSNVGSFVGLIVEDGDVGSSLRIWSVEAGLTGAISPRRQIDVWGGRGFRGREPSWFVGGGLVQRIR